MTDNDNLRQTLSRIAELASAAVKNGSHTSANRSSGAAAAGPMLCKPKLLPERLLVQAAAAATRINPVNAPAFGPMAAAGANVMDPLRIAVMTQKYWGPSPRTLSVSFMETTDPGLRQKILSHMNAWHQTACISFAETGGTGDVRISTGAGGYWSYIGTDITQIPTNRQTMNLEGFTLSMADSEFYRVVRHETGHTLGFPHEHMRAELVALIDPQKAYDYFLTTYGWDKTTVDQQVLTPLSASSIMGTPPDKTSIMCYQLPGSITYDGQPIIGGTDIDTTDYTFAGQIYPLIAAAQSVPADDWDREFTAA